MNLIRQASAQPPRDKKRAGMDSSQVLCESGAQGKPRVNGLWLRTPSAEAASERAMNAAKYAEMAASAARGSGEFRLY